MRNLGKVDPKLQCKRNLEEILETNINKTILTRNQNNFIQFHKHWLTIHVGEQCVASNKRKSKITNIIPKDRLQVPLEYQKKLIYKVTPHVVFFK